MPRPEEKYPVPNYLPDVRFVTCFFTWQSYSNGSKPNLFESHQHVDRSLCPCSLWTKLAWAYHITYADTVQATGSAPRSKELSPINNHLLQLGLRPWLLIFHGSGSLAN
ncbi:unnamed protein product [Fusarium graminearum]|nr:unnamed protein product [Fusarium graminearum]